MDILSKRKINFPGIKVPEINFAKKPQQSLHTLEEKVLLRKYINYALIEWKSATLNFETAESTDMVEYYIYKMKACEVRYQYLLNQIKNFEKDE